MPPKTVAVARMKPSGRNPGFPWHPPDCARQGGSIRATCHGVRMASKRRSHATTQRRNAKEINARVPTANMTAWIKPHANSIALNVASLREEKAFKFLAAHGFCNPPRRGFCQGFLGLLAGACAISLSRFRACSMPIKSPCFLASSRARSNSTLARALSDDWK